MTDDIDDKIDKVLDKIEAHGKEVYDALVNYVQDDRFVNDMRLARAECDADAIDRLHDELNHLLEKYDPEPEDTRSEFEVDQDDRQQEILHDMLRKEGIETDD